MPSNKPPPDSYSHSNATRKNLPADQTEPHVDDDTRDAIPFSPEVREQDESPRLAWQREMDPATKHYDTYPLFVREKLHPGLFARWLQYGADVEETGLQSLWHDFNGLPSEEAKFEWYQHKANWSNRLIHGESAQVMTSLIKREQMAGQVQMIYFDPPYGKSFNSNFQPSVANINVGAGDQVKDLPNDTNTIRAFRDTYTRDIHSYLDQMLEKLTLCRELLHETGSIFVQIGKENVHRLAVVMDEVFGEENRIATIPFVTAGGAPNKLLPNAANYLLYFAKDKTQIKYTQLFEKRTREDWLAKDRDVGVELPGGPSRMLSSEEKESSWKELEEQGGRLFRAMPLVSDGLSYTEPFLYEDPKEGVRAVYPPSGKGWTVSLDALDHLQQQGRLIVTGKSNLQWKKYYDERPGRRIDNVWSGQFSPKNKRFVVQTSEQIVQRCTLMSTNPGDLVLDITCGSGTTATVAEEWGRRWITCDTSPTAISVARQRIAARLYTYWVLADSLEGQEAEEYLVRETGGRYKFQSTQVLNTNDPSQGFIYQRSFDVSAKKLTGGESLEYVYLVDQPIEAEGKVRVASPFTVESTSGAEFQSFKSIQDSIDTKPRERYGAFVGHVVELLKTEGATDTNGKHSFNASDINELHKTEFVTHEVNYQTDNGTERAGLMIAPDDACVPRHAIRQAATEVRKHITDATTLFVLAYESELGSQPLDEELDRVGAVRVVHIRPHRDLMLGDLKAATGHRAFTILGEPDIAVHQSSKGDGWIEIELLGFDTYDPATGETQHKEAKKEIASWMIDIDFDGDNFFAWRLHFPATGEKDLSKLAEDLKVDVKSLRYKASLSTRSAPFKAPDHGRIAVRVITTTGDEMTLEIPDVAKAMIDG